MRETLLLLAFVVGCDPSAQPIDGGAVDGGGAVDARAAVDGGAAPAVCPGHRMPCSQALPGLNCSPTVCERLATGALCCLE